MNIEHRLNKIDEKLDYIYTALKSAEDKRNQVSEEEEAELTEFKSYLTDNNIDPSIIRKGNNFHISLFEFYKQTGNLSPKQLSALSPKPLKQAELKPDPSNIEVPYTYDEDEIPF